MSLDHLKKQAKNLKKVLPEFIREHPTGGALSDCQELVARVNGYPSWHAAVTRLQDAHAKPIASGLRIHIDRMELVELRSDGTEKAPRTFDCLHFGVADADRLNQVTDELDEFLEREGWSQDFGERPAPERNHAMVKLCQKLTTKEPAFLDGYAHWASALVWLEQHEAVIACALPAFENAVSLFPKGFKGRVPYHHLENRPFHRLGHHLVLAYYGVDTRAGDDKAKLLAQQMYRWWPNDNVGFRFLLKPPNEDG